MEPNAEEAAALFAALGDPTRLSIVHRLASAPFLSATRIAQGSPLTRQAIAKHLRVLENAGIVSRRQSGRETHYRIENVRLAKIRLQLDAISQQWDDALARLKQFAENG